MTQRGGRVGVGVAIALSIALPGFVHFPHMRHVKALGTESCVTCHGDVRKMPQVYQVSTLKMGWCVNCHVQHNVSRDCTLCHY